MLYTYLKQGMLDSLQAGKGPLASKYSNYEIKAMNAQGQTEVQVSNILSNMNLQK
jgi:hypothetical protein